MKTASMKLLLCLREMGETQKSFCRKLGISMTYLRSFVHEGKEPPLRIAYEIEKATSKCRFCVNMVEWLSNEAADDKNQEDDKQHDDVK